MVYEYDVKGVTQEVLESVTVKMTVIITLKIFYVDKNNSKQMQKVFLLQLQRGSAVSEIQYLLPCLFFFFFFYNTPQKCSLSTFT